MSSTPSSYYNSKIRGSKIKLLSEDESLILIALSFIWMKTKKKVEFCHFQEGRARISYKKNEGRLYFDLQESLSEHVVNNVLHIFQNNIVTGQFCPLFYHLLLEYFFF